MLAKEEFDSMIAGTERVKKIVLILGTIVLVLATCSVLAQTYQLQARDATVILHSTECDKDWLKGWKKASMTYRGKDYDACWMHHEGIVFLLDSSGDLTPIPVNAFKKMAEG